MQLLQSSGHVFEPFGSHDGALEQSPLARAMIAANTARYLNERLKVLRCICSNHRPYQRAVQLC